MNIQVETADQKLRARARRVIPGGMYGHMRADGLPAGYPQFFARGEGCHIWDVDGRRYVDFMCSWGPNILGHKHPAVLEAVQRQLALGDCLNGPTERLVELAERLVGLIPAADWAQFCKNGTDADDDLRDAGARGHGAAQNSRGARRLSRRRALVHAAPAWRDRGRPRSSDRVCLQRHRQPRGGGRQSGRRSRGSDRLRVPSRLWLRSGIAERRFRPARARAMRQGRRGLDPGRRARGLPAHVARQLGPGWRQARSQRVEQGNRQRPTPLSAVTGNDRFRDAAARLFVTGSFWCGAVPMAAAVATLDELERIDAPRILHELGQRFRDGIAAQSAKAGVGVRQSGPPQMPTILFDGDVNHAIGERFCQETLKRGVYLHPKHNMFLSTAHTAVDIDFALEATEVAFAALAAG